MGKSTICLGENKGVDQLRSYCEADRRLCFATQIVQFLFYSNLKFQDSSSFLGLHRSVCVGPGRKPHCWFSHEAAQILIVQRMGLDFFFFNFEVSTAKTVPKKIV